MKYTPIIGLEVHVELATNSKMFCGCPADHFGKKPNTQTCPVCLGFPGALPVPNKKAVEWTILLGLALGCRINEESKFDRKNYFYPDLPKGYQISQYDQPLCINGSLVIARSESSNDAAISKKQEIASPLERIGNDREIRIRRVHLEEDTGKLLHETVGGARVGLVDFNRSGVPLVEIVTAPDFRTIDEVDRCVKKLQQIIRYLGISGADMEKGTMRIEPSISLQKPGEAKLPNYRVELKNINSFRFVRRGLEYEIDRQSKLLNKGARPIQQTRGFSEDKNVTVAQREKEEAHDYRYFPEPDIPPMRWEKTQISEFRTKIPEQPDEKKTRFMKTYGLNDYDVEQIIETRGKADFFEKAVSQKAEPKVIANWIINKKLDWQAMTPEAFVAVLVADVKVVDISDVEIQKAIDAVVAANQKAVEDYKKGKEQSLMFLLGATMRKIGKKVEAGRIKTTLIARLK